MAPSIQYDEYFSVSKESIWKNLVPGNQHGTGFDIHKFYSTVEALEGHQRKYEVFTTKELIGSDRNPSSEVEPAIRDFLDSFSRIFARYKGEERGRHHVTATSMVYHPHRDRACSEDVYEILLAKNGGVEQEDIDIALDILGWLEKLPGRKDNQICPKDNVIWAKIVKHSYNKTQKHLRTASSDKVKNKIKDVQELLDKHKSKWNDTFFPGTISQAFLPHSGIQDK